MPKLILLVGLCLLAHPVLPALAQEAPKGFVMPLRADEVRAHTTRDVAIIRGTIEWSDGRTTTDVQISCSGRVMTWEKHAIREKGEQREIATWEIEDGFCSVLARSIGSRR